MAEKQKTKGAETLTAHDQLIEFIKLCHIVRTEEGTLNGIKQIEDAEDRLRTADGEVVRAIEFIYGRPNISHINISDLNPEDEKDLGIVIALNSTLKKDKINEAELLIREAIADKKNFPEIPSLATVGIEKAKKALEQFKPVREAYLARGKEQENNKLLQSLAERRLRLEESRTYRLEEADRYNRQISELDKQIAEIAAQIKEEIGKVVNLAERRAKVKTAEPTAETIEPEDSNVVYLEPEISEAIAVLADRKTMEKLAEDVLSQIPSEQYQAFANVLQALINEKSPTPPTLPANVVRLPRRSNETDEAVANAA